MYKELQTKAVMLDEIMQNPEQLDKDVMLEFETKSLRDARELLGNVERLKIIIKDAAMQERYL